MKVLRLPRAKVELGRPLPWNVRDESGKLLLSKGHVVESEHQLDLLLQRGAFVDVDEVRASEAAAAAQVKAASAPPNLFGLWDAAAPDLQSLLARAMEHDFASQVDQFAKHIVDLLDMNADIALYRCVRQDHAQYYWYGYTHSIHTAVLCALMARQLHWPQEKMMSLVKAALTMNCSILELQGQMAGQDTPMKDRQREKIHSHPQASVELLQSISEMAVALRVADVFMAKISPRALRDALSPQVAVRQLYTEDDGGALSTAVVKQFGIYPPGDFVKLASGELAIVVQRTSNAKAPIVASVTDTAGLPSVKTVRRDTGRKEFAILGAVADKALLKRLAPERLYGFSDVPAKAAP